MEHIFSMNEALHYLMGRQVDQWVEKSSTTPRVSGSIPGCSRQHVTVSSNKIPKPRSCCPLGILADKKLMHSPSTYT